MSSPSPSLPRPEKNGAATGVDAVCTHRPDPKGWSLDRERLYWELSQLTHGVTQLGSYTLDQESLYINGEGLSSFFAFQQVPHPLSPFFPLPHPAPTSPNVPLSVQVTPTRSRPPPPAVSILRLQKSLQPSECQPLGMEEARSPLPSLPIPTSPPGSENKDQCPLKPQTWAPPSWHLQDDEVPNPSPWAIFSPASVMIVSSSMVKSCVGCGSPPPH